MQDSSDSGAPPELPESPQSVWGLAYARPFRVAEPFTHWWRAERPAVTTGYLVVLNADPDLLVPRETAEPVLYIGEQTGERVNKGHWDGALVAIVPSLPDAQGWPALDLSSVPIWFGSAELPERVDAVHIATELAAASAAGVTLFSDQRVATALQAGGTALDAADRTEVEQEAARLVLRFAPSEEDLARGLLVPRER